MMIRSHEFFGIGSWRAWDAVDGKVLSDTHNSHIKQQFRKCTHTRRAENAYPRTLYRSFENNNDTPHRSDILMCGVAKNQESVRWMWSNASVKNVATIHKQTHILAANGATYILFLFIPNDFIFRFTSLSSVPMCACVFFYRNSSLNRRCRLRRCRQYVVLLHSL